MTVTTWSVPRESREWVGPITVTATVDGTTTPVDPTALAFAVLPAGSRPVTDDWTAPVAEPGGDGTKFGVQADPVDSYQRLGIWVRVTDSPEIPVLDPSTVGKLIRT